MSKTTLGSKGEFTLHVPKEYDYRFLSEKYFHSCAIKLFNSYYRRDEIISILKARYCDILQINLPIFGIEKNDLREFTTTERDMKRQISRFPPN